MAEIWCRLADPPAVVVEPSNSVPVPEIGEKDDEPNERMADGRHNEVDWGDKGLETRIHLPSIPQGTAVRGRERLT